MMRVDSGIFTALRNEVSLADARLEILRDFTLSVVRGSGH